MWAQGVERNNNRASSTLHDSNFRQGRRKCIDIQRAPRPQSLSPHVNSFRERDDGHALVADDRTLRPAVVVFLLDEVYVPATMAQPHPERELQVITAVTTTAEADRPTRRTGLNRVPSIVICHHATTVDCWVG